MKRIKNYKGRVDWSKPIILDGRESKYRIFRNGKLISFYFGRWVVIKPSINQGGYHQVSLHVGKVKYNKLIHRLVGECFIDNFNNLPQINHNNGNKLKNGVKNLKWCTSSENSQHAHDTGLTSVFRRTKGAIPKKVGKYFSGVLVKSYDAIAYVADDGYPRTSIQRAAKNQGIYQGFQWKFLS